MRRGDRFIALGGDTWVRQSAIVAVLGWADMPDELSAGGACGCAVVLSTDRVIYCDVSAHALLNRISFARERRNVRHELIEFEEEAQSNG